MFFNFISNSLRLAAKLLSSYYIADFASFNKNTKPPSCTFTILLYNKLSIRLDTIDTRYLTNFCMISKHTIEHFCTDAREVI